jgi:hypothetical protein
MESELVAGLHGVAADAARKDDTYEDRIENLGFGGIHLGVLSQMD